ncbi:hypothetical protein Dimus_008365 [Dionaea muscipula]
MSVIHLKKKDVVKSKVRGVDMEFDHEKLATILGIPGNNGIREYVKDVWEESKYIKPLEITKRRRDNDVAAPEGEAEEEEERNQGDFDWEAVVDEATVEGESGSGEKFYDAEDKDQGSPEVQEEIPAAAHKVRLSRRNSIVRSRPSCPTRTNSLRREDGVWWIGSGENRRRDNDVVAPEGEAEVEEERNQGDFDWEAVVDEAAVEGESGSGEKFYDAEDKDQGSPEVQEEIPAAAPQSSAQQKGQIARSRPSCPT